MLMPLGQAHFKTVNEHVDQEVAAMYVLDDILNT